MDNAKVSLQYVLVQKYRFAFFCLCFESKRGKIKLLVEKGNFSVGHAEKNQINSL